MTIWTAVFFVVGIAGLVVGAEALVRGAARLAARTGLSPVVIGLTVVAFGTSAPELAVSLGASWRGETDLAVGNVVGSNIANMLLVLGVSAAVGGSLLVARRIIRIDVPIMIALSLLVFGLGLDNKLERWEGIVFVALLITYITWTIASTRRGAMHAEGDLEDDLSEEKLRESSAFADLGFVVLGLVLLVVGSQALVESATDIARALDVSELVIGLTVVAIGTSLPEVATSMLAAFRGQRDLAVGNAVGSNLFNILAVLGVTAAVSPNALDVPDSAISLDLPVMVAVAVVCLPLFMNGGMLNRWEGIAFLTFYAAYLVYLVLDSADSAAKNQYAIGVLGVLLPLTILAIVADAVRKRGAGPSLS